MFNLARIVKLYGTMARKGDNTADRPHRKSRVLEIPSALQVVPQELLEALAKEAKQESARQQTVTVIAPAVPIDREGVMQRARSYLKKIPGAISGQHGHDQNWCAANGYQALGAVMFGKEISRLFPKVSKRRIGGRQSRQYVYEGIRHCYHSFNVLLKPA